MPSLPMTKDGEALPFQIGSTETGVALQIGDRSTEYFVVLELPPAQAIMLGEALARDGRKMCN